MPKLTKSVPKCRHHKRSGQAIVTLNGRDHRLGPYGTKASLREYNRLVGEWLARDRQPLVDDADLTIAEVIARYWTFAKKKYVQHGKPKPAQFHVKSAIRHLKNLYASHPAVEFTPRQLKVVRESMIATGWARTYINQQVAVLVRMFKWAAVEGLVPAAVHAALDLVDGLRRNDSAARETNKVQCIADATVEATLSHVTPTVRAMIQLQRATAMRPGELCIIRPGDIDRTGDVWEYRPTEHKTAYLEQDRLICIGPNGQDILRQYLLRPADAYCFSPCQSIEQHRAERHALRTTPMSCGNVPGSNRQRRPKRTPRDRYDVASYRRAIHRACDRAFPATADVAADPKALATWQSEHRWSPHQLRHTAATQIRKQFGIEAAKAVLGHSATNVTGIYAEVDRQQAVEAMRKSG